MKRIIIFICGLFIFNTHARTPVTLVARKTAFPNQLVIGNKRPRLWSVVGEYSQNTDQDSIPCMLFGRSLLPNSRTLPISGSAVANRRLFDWFADYFGLPPDFQSLVTFTPRVQNVIVDASLLTTLPPIPGAFIRVDMPFMYTSWGMHLDEQVVNQGVQGYQAGYFTPQTVQRGQLLNRFTDFITGCAAPYLGVDPRPLQNQGGSAPRKDILFDPLQASKISLKPLSKVGFAECHVQLGYIVWATPGNMISLNAHVVAPLGSHIRSEYLFQPILGNGHFWEVGPGFTIKFTPWSNKESNMSFNVFCEAYFNHLFPTRQSRTFDLRGNLGNSRYVLAQEMGGPVQDNLRGGSLAATATPAIAQFRNHYAPVANLTSIDVDVSIRLQTIVATFASLMADQWTVTLGYVFFNRSCEDISIACDCPLALSNPRRWAVKGDAHVFGYDPLLANKPVALSATQNNAVIAGGYNTVLRRVAAGQARNPLIDNRQPAWSGSDALVAFPGSAAQTNTSIQPLFLDINKINIDGGRTRIQINRFLCNIGYAWNNKGHYLPFVGLGARLDLGTKRQQFISQCCSYFALSFWGVWLQGGFGFA